VFSDLIWHVCVDVTTQGVFASQNDETKSFQGIKIEEWSGVFSEIGPYPESILSQMAGDSAWQLKVA
jgi:hypothetical protein